MRFIPQLFLCAVFNAFCATSAFEARTASSASLSDVEAKRYERHKKMPGVKKVMLIAINAEAFSNGAWTDIPMFDNATERFQVSKDESGAVWKGKSGNNFDRFVLRNINGRYSGHVLVKGRQYVITPIKRGVSAMHEVSGNVECGMDAVKDESHEK